MEFRVKIEDLKKIGLTLTQYLYMWGLYNQVEVKYIDIKEEGVNSLLNSEFIVYLDNRHYLTTKGIELFEPSNGIFNEFISVFPTRVSNISGTVRVLSPVEPDSLSGQKLKKKWYSITKNKVELEEKILSCLKEEIELRKKEGSLYWMRNAETWLNKATWEDYEYLLEQPKSEERGSKIGEIKL